MTNQVTYLMSGPAHLPNLVVSAYTLREHWSGPIEVHAWPESYDIVARIATDPRLGIRAVRREPTFPEPEPNYRGKTAQFLDKIKLTQSLDCDASLYLDADTIIRGNLDPLFSSANHWGLTLTQFNDWQTQGKTISKRIKRLIGREPIEQDLVELLLSRRWPSVNGGVWAARPDSPALQLWYDWTWAVRDIFIADETILHTIMAKFDQTKDVDVLLSGRYNMSPRHANPNVDPDTVVVWHFHGDSNLRAKKRGVDIWWPVYQKCLANNIGGIADWKDTVDSKYLKKLETEKSNA